MPSAIPAVNIQAGNIVQVVNTQTGAYSTTATTIPYDNTSPQNTEGAEFMTLAITPTSATNILEITIVVIGTIGSNATNFSAPLFQDSAADALATATSSPYNGGITTCLSYKYRMVSGTVSSTAFKVRCGSSAGSFAFNGDFVGARHNGLMASSITIKEIQA